MLVSLVLTTYASPWKGNFGQKNMFYKDQVLALSYVLLLKTSVWLGPAAFAWGGFLKAQGHGRQGHKMWEPLSLVTHSSVTVVDSGPVMYVEQRDRMELSCTDWLPVDGTGDPQACGIAVHIGMFAVNGTHTSSWFCSEADYTCNPHPTAGVASGDPNFYANIRV